MRPSFVRVFRSAVAPYAVAVLSVVLASLLAFALNHLLDRGIVALYLAAVVVSAWYGGFRSGMVATVLSLVISDYYFIDPANSFGVNRIDDAIQLTVFSLVSFLINLLNNAQRRAQQLVLQTKERLTSIVTGALDAIVELDREGRVTEWNPQAEGLFGCTRQEAIGKGFVETFVSASDADRTELATPADWPDIINRRIERNCVDRNGRNFPAELSFIAIKSEAGKTYGVFVRDITDRKRREAELKVLNENLEARVREETARLSLLFDITRAANEAEFVGHAFKYAVRRLCTDGLWRYCRVYQPSKESPATFVHTRPLQSVLEEPWASLSPAIRSAPTLLSRVLERGDIEWVEDIKGANLSEDYGPLLAAGLKSAVAFPVKAGREIVAVVECFTDRTVKGSENLLPAMTAVGLELGRVVERRRLQEGYTEAVWEQQRKIAQELHDSLGQELSGVGYLAKSLAESLKGTDQFQIAEMAKEGIGRSLDQIRGMAKGVLPVDLDSEGLMAALEQLAETTSSVFGIKCHLVCYNPVFVDDNAVALHLYRIAQESVTNAVKHGRAKQISITLSSSAGGLKLTVRDDGSGLPEIPSPSGSGLKIMKYRAAAIGAKLTLERGPEGGTVVTCSLPVEEYAGRGIEEP
jgi:PAS domain S-box-containing protein